MNHIKWITAYQIITKETVLFIHKVIYDNQLKAITQLFKFSLSNSQNHRVSRKYLVVEDHNSKCIKKSLIYMGNFLYNELPLG